MAQSPGNLLDYKAWLDREGALRRVNAAMSKVISWDGCREAYIGDDGLLHIEGMGAYCTVVVAGPAEPAGSKKRPATKKDWQQRELRTDRWAR